MILLYFIPFLIMPISTFGIMVPDVTTRSLQKQVEQLTDQLEKFNKLYLTTLDRKITSVTTTLSALDANFKTLQEKAHVWDIFRHHIDAWNDAMKAVDHKIDLIKRTQDDNQSIESKLTSLEFTLNHVLNKVDQVNDRTQERIPSFEQKLNDLNRIVSNWEQMSSVDKKDVSTRLNNILRRVINIESGNCRSTRSPRVASLVTPAVGMNVATILKDMEMRLDKLADHLAPEDVKQLVSVGRQNTETLEEILDLTRGVDDKTIKVLEVQNDHSAKLESYCKDTSNELTTFTESADLLLKKIEKIVLAMKGKGVVKNKESKGSKDSDDSDDSDDSKDSDSKDDDDDSSSSSSSSSESDESGDTDEKEKNVKKNVKDKIGKNDNDDDDSSSSSSSSSSSEEGSRTGKNSSKKNNKSSSSSSSGDDDNDNDDNDNSSSSSSSSSEEDSKATASKKDDDDDSNSSSSSSEEDSKVIVGSKNGKDDDDSDSSSSSSSSSSEEDSKVIAGSKKNNVDDSSDSSSSSSSSSSSDEDSSKVIASSKNDDDDSSSSSSSSSSEEDVKVIAGSKKNNVDDSGDSSSSSSSSSSSEEDSSKVIASSKNDKKNDDDSSSSSSSSSSSEEDSKSKANSKNNEDDDDSESSSSSSSEEHAKAASSKKGKNNDDDDDDDSSSSSSSSSSEEDSKENNGKSKKTTKLSQKQGKRVKKFIQPSKTGCHDLKAPRKDGVYQFEEPDMNDAGRDFNERYCDFKTSGAGWTVIQRRGPYDQQENFNRSWVDYKNGFGNLSKDFWFGLEFMHRLTDTTPYVLRIELEDFDGQEVWAEYSYFQISQETDNYALTIGEYKGNASDSMAYHAFARFSTYDRNNDNTDHPCCPCAPGYGSGWWFDNCSEANLNGIYRETPEGHDYIGVVWEKWRGDYSLKATRMLIRPLDSDSGDTATPQVPEDP